MVVPSVSAVSRLAFLPFWRYSRCIMFPAFRFAGLANTISAMLFSVSRAALRPEVRRKPNADLKKEVLSWLNKISPENEAVILANLCQLEVGVHQNPPHPARQKE